MFLLDTNIVSELRRPRPDKNVLAWLAAVPQESICISAVTLGELQAGVELLRQRDANKAGAIEAWMDAVADSHDVLPMDGEAFRVYARLMHRRPRELFEDAMIAATAIVHKLTVASRNLRDFERLGVPVVDPFRDAAGRR